MTTRAARSRAALASEGHVQEAAEALLAGGGNAVDAVVAGVLAACAMSPGVLLGPVQALVGGAGAGLLAIDGRVRQPGEGTARPRGFVPDAVIPEAAHVGVPTLVAALSGFHAAAGQSTWLRVTEPARERADGARKAVIERIAQRGARAFVEEAIGGELVASCGPVPGGLLTMDDLATLKPEVRPLGNAVGTVAHVPWLDEVDGSRVHAVLAIDFRGVVAVACYESAIEGVNVEALGLIAPRAARPVLRGETRVRPGTPCPAAAPIALVQVARTYDAGVAVVEAASWRTKLEAAPPRLGDLEPFEASPRIDGRVLAIVQSDEGVRTITSAIGK